MAIMANHERHWHVLDILQAKHIEALMFKFGLCVWYGFRCVSVIYVMTVSPKDIRVFHGILLYIFAWTAVNERTRKKNGSSSFFLWLLNAIILQMAVKNASFSTQGNFYFATLSLPLRIYKVPSWGEAIVGFNTHTIFT